MDMESMESIEPLASLLSLYKEKEKVLRHYLPQKTLYKLKNAYFYEKNTNDLFLNDTLYCIHKSNGLLDHSGKIIRIHNSRITLKLNTQNITIDENEYYLFIQKTKHKNNANYFKALLKSFE